MLGQLRPLLAMALLLGVSMSHAQPRDRAGSDALFRQGRAAMERGDFEEACGKFEESQKLDPAPGTLLNLSACLEKLGRPASASARVKEALEQMPAKDERRGYAEERLRALEKLIPRLSVKLAPGAPTGTRVTRDGIELGSASLGVALPMDPGRVKLVVTAPGRRDREIELTLVQGESKEQLVDAGPAIEARPREPAPVASRTESSSSSSSLGYVVGGIGLASFSVSMITGAMALSRKGTVQDHCDGSRCDQTGVDAASSGRTLSLVSTITFAVGIAGMGAGTYLILSRDKSGAERAAVHAAVTGGGGSLALTGRFQ